MARNEEEEDSTYDTVAGMAERLGLKGKERSKYIHEHMTGLGYEPEERSYRKAQNESDDDDSGGRFGLGRRSRGGQGGSGRGRRGRDDDDDFF